MTIDNRLSVKNLVHTPLSTNCRLCHCAGFSNLCTFSMGGECPYMSFRKSQIRADAK